MLLLYEMELMKETLSLNLIEGFEESSPINVLLLLV